MGQQRETVDVVVVGAGPNGLASAVILARAGLEVEVHEALGEPGGGARTTSPDDSGFRYDVCSAVHPMASASPFFQAFDLAAHGVTLLQPEVAYAHPLDGGQAGLAWHDLARTRSDLGADGAAWCALFGPLTERWQQVTEVCMSDFRRPPLTASLAALRLVGAVAGQVSPLRRLRFRGEVAPAMLAGVSAHSILPPDALSATGTGLMLAMLAHAVGWPVPAGGSRAISAALASDLRCHGGRIVLGHQVKTLADLPRARAVVLNLGPAGVLAVAGRDLPYRYARQLRAYRYGGAASTVQFALSEPVPWAAHGCSKAGTLHLAGSRDEVLTAERAVRSGRHADRPYVLAIQPGVVDPTRATGGRHVLTTYAHVPNGSAADVTEAVIAQVARFAPGFRDVIIGHEAISAARLSEHSANYVGGDIATGAMTFRQIAFRPVPRWDPYAVPLPGVYMCSAAVPPGPGVHGMAGWHVARRILRHRFGIRTHPCALLRGTSGTDEADVADRHGPLA